MKIHRPFREWQPAVKALVYMLPVTLTVFLHDFIIKQPPITKSILKEYYLESANSFNSVFSFVILSPIIEELIFRGPTWLILLLTLCLFKKFPDKKIIKIIGYTLTILMLCISSYFWAREHHYPITIFGYGLVWGWLMIKTRSIVYPILFHAGGNALALLAIFFGFHFIY